jgi:hypothetical protein
MFARGRPKLREKEVVDYFKQRAAANDLMFLKVKWIGRKNAPDGYVTGISKHPGARVDYNNAWIEFKAPGRIASFAQKREHTRLRSKGDEVFVIDSFDSVNMFFARVMVFQIDEPSKGVQ